LLLIIHVLKCPEITLSSEWFITHITGTRTLPITYALMTWIWMFLTTQLLFIQHTLLKQKGEYYNKCYHREESGCGQGAVYMNDLWTCVYVVCAFWDVSASKPAGWSKWQSTAVME
jgi:hypothetical protein